MLVPNQVGLAPMAEAVAADITAVEGRSVLAAVVVLVSRLSCRASIRVPA